MYVENEVICIFNKYPRGFSFEAKYRNHSGLGGKFNSLIHWKIKDIEKMPSKVALLT